MGVIPIVNENDTLAVSEIKFGDNDTLSAITAGMVHADMLFLMTDVDCLYDSNPRTNPNAQPIEVVEDIAQIVADGKFSNCNSPCLGYGANKGLQSPNLVPPSGQAVCPPR
jgi:glutamate 5-kinase